MIVTLPSHRHPPAQNLFCGSETVSASGAADRPAISLKARESFTSHFAAAFCAAMTEHRHENGDKGHNAA